MRAAALCAVSHYLQRPLVRRRISCIGSGVFRKPRTRVSCCGRRPTGRRGGRGSSIEGRFTKSSAKFVNGRRVVLPRSAVVPTAMGRVCVVAIVWLLTCCLARVAATVTRDSRNTCRRWNAVGGGCTCDRTSALSDVFAPLWELDQWFSQLGVVDGWATRGRAKLGRTHVQARDVARVCVCVVCFGLALQAIIAKGNRFSVSQSRGIMEKGFSEKCVRNEICQNAARVPQSRWREHWALCTPADRWTKFWQGTSMLESRSSAVSEALVTGVAMAF